MKKREAYVILHNVRSAVNVGAIFRTADSAGISKMYLTGYTPTPVDRFGRARKDIAKTALGAESYMPWEYIKSPTQLIGELKKNDILVVGVEQAAGAKDYKAFRMTNPIAFIFGNEVLGLSKQLLRCCDSIISIPMYGKKESLNVSVAAGIVLFRTLDR